MLGLDEIHGITTLRTYLTVRVDQSVEVNLTICLSTCQIAISCCPVGQILLRAVINIVLVKHVIIAARHQFPVVGLWVVAVVVVQLGALVH